MTRSQWRCVCALAVLAWVRPIEATTIYVAAANGACTWCVVENVTVGTAPRKATVQVVADPLGECTSKSGSLDLDAAANHDKSGATTSAVTLGRP